MQDDNHNKTPQLATSIDGAEPGEMLRTTHRAPFLTRGTDEQFNHRLEQKTREWNEISGREL